jgi:hypothetical protein
VIGYCLSGALFGIYNSNHHDGKSLFHRRSGSYRVFFGTERSFDLSVYPNLKRNRLSTGRA